MSKMGFTKSEDDAKCMSCKRLSSLSLRGKLQKVHKVRTLMLLIFEENIPKIRMQ